MMDEVVGSGDVDGDDDAAQHCCSTLPADQGMMTMTMIAVD
jgi:hypothetical protein